MAAASYGRYELRGEIGHGGMGAVYRAWDPRFRREVAIKVLSRQLLSNADSLTRFDREARAVASLEHAAIVPVYDYGEEGDEPYLVLRLLSAGSLADRIARGPMDVEQVAAIVRRVASALDHAHAHGVVHRDVKPANILFDEQGDAWLGDFGIARMSAHTSSLTGLGVIGSPHYMSPEQAEGKEATPASDIYSLGATVYEALAGSPPFQADHPLAIMLKHLREEPLPLIGVRRDLPPAVGAAVSRCMAKDPARRFATASEFAAALGPSVDAGATRTGEAVPLPQPPGPPPAHMPASPLTLPAGTGTGGGAPPGTPPTGYAPQSGAAWESGESRPPPAPKRGKLGVGIAVAAAVLLVAIALFAVFRPLRDSHNGGAGSSGGDDTTARKLQTARQQLPLDLARGNKLGKDDAPVKLSMFEDFQCPFCLRFTADHEPTIVEEYVKTGKVQLIFRNLPILGAESTAAAVAGLCAASQNKFWEYHSRLFMVQADAGQDREEKTNAGRFSSDNLKSYASDVGLDRAQFDPCLDGNRFLQQVQDDAAEARAKGLTGTLGFLANGVASASGNPVTIAGWRAVLDRLVANASTTTPASSATPRAASSPAAGTVTPTRAVGAAKPTITLVYNANMTPFNNTSVRQALSLSTESATVLWTDRANVSPGPPAGSFDLASAKVLIGLAGYPSGASVKGTLTNMASKRWDDILVRLIAEWKTNLGVEITLMSLEDSVYSQRVAAGNYQAYVSRLEQ
jgi:serine/threonine-protein kinase